MKTSEVKDLELAQATTAETSKNLSEDTSLASSAVLTPAAGSDLPFVALIDCLRFSQTTRSLILGNL
jgi:hypothetical protein